MFGAALALGGSLLAGQSTYSTLAGGGLILGGALLTRRQRTGAWLLLAVFAITLIWSLGNLRADGTDLAMRLVGPTIVLGLIGLVMPALRGWRPKRTITIFIAALSGTVAFGICSVAGAPFARPTATLAEILIDYPNI